MKNKSAEFFRNFEIFNNENLGKVRTLTDEENNIWFFANDICECLGYNKEHYSHIISKHSDPEDRRALKYGDSHESCKSDLWVGNDRKAKTFINEAGMYQLIFTSQMPAANQFKKWVTHEVIPSIKEHGGYILGQEKLAEKDRAMTDKLIGDLHDKIAFLQKQRHMHIANGKALKEENKDLKAKTAKLNNYLQEEEDRNESLYLELKGKELEITQLMNRIEQLEDPETFEMKQNAIRNRGTNDVKYVSADGLVSSQPYEVDR